MAVNAAILRRPSDKALFIAAAAVFPLLVLIGYFKSYYFMAFFPDARPIANTLVHAHGIVMSVWVLYFVAQVALIRTKNYKIHMTMGMFGVVLAAVVAVVGLATAYDSNFVRRNVPPGNDPHEFFLLPLGDMLIFVGLFAAAIYYRKRSAEHKGLMLLTAVNFVPAALFRIAPWPGYEVLWAFGGAALLGVTGLIWQSRVHGKINRVYAVALAIIITSLPARIWFGQTALWHSIANAIAP